MRRSGSVRVDSASAAHHRREQEDYCEYRIRHVERESHDRGPSSIAHAECLDRPHPAHDGRSKPRERNEPHYPGGNGTAVRYAKYAAPTANETSVTSSARAPFDMCALSPNKDGR